MERANMQRRSPEGQASSDEPPAQFVEKARSSDDASAVTQNPVGDVAAPGGASEGRAITDG